MMNKIIKIILILTFTYVLSGCSLTSKGFESNINPETGDEFKNTDLVSYSCSGDNETVEKLLRLGLDHLIDNALLCAIESDDLETVKTLVKEGADINWINEEGENALLYALERKSYNLIDYLLDEGLDPYQEDNEGENILGYLLKPFLYNGHDLEEDPKSLFKTLETLKEHEVKIEDMKIKVGFYDEIVLSPLIYAIEYIIPLVTHALLSAGFEFDLSNEYELGVIEEYEYLSGFGNSNRQLISCMINSYSHISSVYISSNAWPSCDELFSSYYETYQISEPIGTATKSNDIAEDSDQEREEERKAEEERKDNPMFPMTASEALAILQNSYPDYTFLGGGELSYSEYNEGKGINEPAYIYAFRKDEDVYTGWVFADGSFKFRFSGEYVQE